MKTYLKFVIVTSAIVAVAGLAYESIMGALDVVEEDRQAKADEMIAALRQTGPGWQR